MLDLGCGPGNSTALLAERYPAAHITGIDTSEEMLRAARADHPQLEWVKQDIASYRPTTPVDLSFSNAALHWLPDHVRLFPELLACVRPGGVFAMQMPFNFEEPSHRLMREIARTFALDPVAIRALTRLGTPEHYYDLLAPLCRSVDLWVTRYEQVMVDAAAIVEWVKGTGLRPYLEALSEGERAPFLAAYTEAIDQAYPTRSDGKRLFSFPRIFMVCQR